MTARVNVRPAQPVLPDPSTSATTPPGSPHQLDAAMGHHTLYSAEESDRLIVLNTAGRPDRQRLAPVPRVGRDRTRGADRRRRVRRDAAVEARPTPSSRASTPTSVASATSPPSRGGSCSRPTCHCSAASTGRAWSTPPTAIRRWEPRFVDVATTPHSSFYEQLRVDYHRALTHYDNVVGVQDLA